MLLKLLTLYYRSRIRGSYRLTQLLSKVFSLSDVAIPTLYGKVNVDLRAPYGQGLAATALEESADAATMKRFLRKGFCSYDIGAHWGIYAGLMAQYGPTYAFEPNASIFSHLGQTANRLGFEAFNVALSDKEGEVRFFVPEEASMASLVNWTNTSLKVRESVCKTVKLDDLGLKPPDFIKLDVEGAELKVLRGATKTIEKARPIIYMEVMAPVWEKFGYSHEDVTRFFTDYKMFNGNTEVDNLDFEWANITLIPKEKLPRAFAVFE